MKAEMTTIQLEFSCTTKDGKCIYSNQVCIDVNPEEEHWVCGYLKATRKKEKASQIKRGD